MLHLSGDDEILLWTGLIVRVDVRRFLQGSAAVSFGVDPKGDLSLAAGGDLS